MNNIFGQESKFFKVMNTLGSIIGVSIMWLICCIPIVTIGASTIALYYTTAKAIRHETGYITGEFKKSFKNNLKDGVIITVIYLFLVAVLYVDYMVINNLNSSFAVMLGGMYMLITLVMFGVFVYIFPAMSRFTMGKLGCFKLALLMTFKHLPSTILLMIIFAISVVLILLIPVPMIFVIPGLCCYVSTFIIERLLKKYMAKPETEEEKEKWYYK